MQDIQFKFMPRARVIYHLNTTIKIAFIANIILQFKEHLELVLADLEGIFINRINIYIVNYTKIYRL